MRKLGIIFCVMLALLLPAQVVQAPLIDTRISRGFRSILASDMKADLTFLASQRVDGITAPLVLDGPRHASASA